MKFMIEIDASRQAIGAILLREEYPIFYFSKKLPFHLCKASDFVQDLYAIVKAIHK